MRDHERDGAAVLPRQRQAFLRDSAHGVGIERHKVRPKETEQHGKHNQWILERLARRLGALDKQARLLEGGFGFRRREAPRIHQRLCETDLQINLHPALA